MNEWYHLVAKDLEKYFNDINKPCTVIYTYNGFIIRFDRGDK